MTWRASWTLGAGAKDIDVLALASDTDRVVLTYDRKDFRDALGHAGVLLADESMASREVRLAVDRIERLYPDLDDVIEYLSDWS